MCFTIYDRQMFDPIGLPIPKWRTNREDTPSIEFFPPRHADSVLGSGVDESCIKLEFFVVVFWSAQLDVRFRRHGLRRACLLIWATANAAHGVGLSGVSCLPNGRAGRAS